MGQYITNQKDASFPKVIIAAVIIGVLLAVIIVVCTRDSHDGSHAYPQLEFYPKPNESQKSLISIRVADGENSYMDYVYKANQLLAPYYLHQYTAEEAAAMMDCSFERYPGREEFCDFDTKQLQSCQQEKRYGYYLSAPCIFLKLKTKYLWMPEFYNDTAHLPAEMPEQLKNHINSLSPLQRNTIWVSCEGKTANDTAHLGTVQYFANVQGFPGYYYPYRHVPGYLSPLVAVQFVRPARTLVNVECKAWAKNIKHGEEDSVGETSFQLLID